MRIHRALSIIITIIVGMAWSPTVMANRVTITTSPQEARIYVNGVLKGKGKIQLNIPRKECVTVEVRLEGFVQEIRTYCNKRNEANPHKDYIQLQADEALTSSTPSNYVNNETLLSVKSTKTREDAWSYIYSSVLNTFEDIDLNDARAGYLRTAWIGNSFKNNTVRIRIIIRQTSDDPLAYKIKFTSEESGKPGTPVNNADGLYKPFNRMLKKYDQFIEELMAKLKN
jgi:hypothetical protein